MNDLAAIAPVEETMTGRTVRAGFELASCFRQYMLQESLDHEKAVADFIDGLLALRIPDIEAASRASSSLYNRDTRGRFSVWEVFHEGSAIL
jgi:HSP20 family molecular chaperone IbpA